MTKKAKTFKILTIISAGLSLAGIIYSFILPAVVKSMLRDMLNKAGMHDTGSANISIIGGADGPTSIFVASFSEPVQSIIKYVITGFLSVGTIVFFILYRKTKRHE